VAGDFKFKYFSPILWASWLILALITLHWYRWHYGYTKKHIK
jgi:hypothetical protein